MKTQQIPQNHCGGTMPHNGHHYAAGDYPTVYCPGTPAPVSHYAVSQPGQYPAPRADLRTSSHIPPRKRMPKWGVALIVVGGLFAVMSGGATALIGGADLATQQADRAPVVASEPTAPVSTYDPGINTPEPTQAPTTTRKPPEESPTYLPEDGTLLVGKDVKPGVYRTRMPADSLQCYWARLKDIDGGLDSIIDNALTMQAGAVVTLHVRASDYAIEINCGGAQWKRIAK